MLTQNKLQGVKIEERIIIVFSKHLHVALVGFFPRLTSHLAIVCSRLSDSESREDAKVKGTPKVGGAGKGVLPLFFFFFTLALSQIHRTRLSWNLEQANEAMAVCC